MLPEPGYHRFSGPGAFDPVNLFSIPEQHYHRDASHPETGRKCRVLICVHLNNRSLSCQLLGYCSHRRCE